MKETNTSKDDNENNFINSILNVIDNKFNDEFFNFVVKKGYCIKLAGIIQPDY